MTVYRVLIVLVLMAGSGFSQARTIWQTTHGHRWVMSGECRLVSTAFKVTAHSLYVDVEEEAVISTEFNGPWQASIGDSATLEIVGEFKVTPGTAVRSMLLWNGSTLLKAKLKDRSTAEKEYEEVVDRDAPVVVPRDPAFIEYLGNNIYRYKIYPVEVRKSRKIRILYTIPLAAGMPGIGFDIKPAFLFGCSIEALSTVPVTISQAPHDTTSWYIQDSQKRREVENGGTYLLPRDAFNIVNNAGYYIYRTPDALKIRTDTPRSAWAEQFESTDSITAGHYSAFVLSVNDVLASVIKIPEVMDHFFSKTESDREGVPTFKSDSQAIAYLRDTTSLEAVVDIGSKKYVLDGSGKVCVVGFFKSGEAWNRQVAWNMFDATGKKVHTLQQVVPAVSDSISDAGLLPLLWAAKYSLKENAGDLGGTYGFVDRKMTLLALEKDSLSADVAGDYAQNGVPVLLPEEILPGVSGSPVPPEESAIFEFETKITAAAADHLQTFQMHLLAGNVLSAVAEELAGQKSCMVQVFDLRGRLLFVSKGIAAQGNRLTVALPQQLRGICMVRISAGKFSVVRQLTL